MENNRFICLRYSAISIGLKVSLNFTNWNRECNLISKAFLIVQKREEKSLIQKVDSKLLSNRKAYTWQGKPSWELFREIICKMFFQHNASPFVLISRSSISSITFTSSPFSHPLGNCFKFHQEEVEEGRRKFQKCCRKFATEHQEERKALVVRYMQSTRSV